MLFSLRDVNEVITLDDGIVQVEDINIDVRTKRIKHLICKLGGKVFSKEVLVSPLLIISTKPRDGGIEIYLGLDRDKLLSLPERRTVKTFSDIAKENYFKNTVNFGKENARSIFNFGKLIEFKDKKKAVQKMGSSTHSLQELEGYFVDGHDYEYGCLVDILAETNGWDLDYIVVDQSYDQRSDLRILPFDYFDSVSWHAESLYLNLRGVAPRSLPRYPPSLSWRDPSFDFEEQVKLRKEKLISGWS